MAYLLCIHLCFEGDHYELTDATTRRHQQPCDAMGTTQQDSQKVRVAKSLNVKNKKEQSEREK